MKLALQRIDWFRVRGFLLGQDKSKDIYYLVDSGTRERIDFGSLQEAQIYAEHTEAYREIENAKLEKDKTIKPEGCPNLDCSQENRNTCFRCGWNEGNLVVGEELAEIWHNTPTIRRPEEILLLIGRLKQEAIR